jgi:hypothetical protein
VGKGLTRKIEQEEKRGGSTVIRKKRRDRSLDSHHVRYSKPGLMSHFKLIMNCCLDVNLYIEFLDLN